MTAAHRDTIFVEDAEVISQTAWPGDQYVTRLRSPRCALHARAGMFAHVRCAADLPMRRPLSIMRASASEGWIELLYKVVGEGLRQLGRVQPGDNVSLIGPIGRGFTVDPARPVICMIGGGVGIPPLIFLAEQLAVDSARAAQLVAFLGSELPFPFELAEQPAPLPGVPAAATRGIALLDKLGVPSRLASQAGHAGCFDGLVTGLADAWLSSLSVAERDRVVIAACGPGPMLAAAQRLAVNYRLPSQLCLEEYMACAVGGCAGCSVAVTTPDGIAMKRVCVDGPVFDGATVRRFN